MKVKVDDMLNVAMIFASPYRQGFPPRGMLYIVSYVKKHCEDIHFTCFDFIPNEDYDWNQFDVIGISCLTAHYSYADAFVKKIRSTYRGAIVLGGIHFSLVRRLPEWAEYGMFGEGEQTSLELYRLLSENRHPAKEELEKIDGLAFRFGNKIVFNKERELIKNLDDIPFADLDAIDIEQYLRPNNTFGTKIGRGLSLVTSRGCAFNCEFCTARAMWKGPRFHSAKYVVDEIEYLVKRYRVEMLYITDDNFCTNIRRLKEIAKLMEERQLPVTLGASGRIEYYNDEIRDCYRKMGIKALSFGFETGSDRMLKQIKNGQRLNVQQTIDMANRIADDGIEVQGLYMMNMPGETEADLDMTVDMIHKIRMSKLAITIATPFYGTKWWDVAVAQGIVPEDPEDTFWATYDLADWQPGRPLFKTNISLEKLKETYSKLKDYRNQLFFFDWKNRD